MNNVNKFFILFFLTAYLCVSGILSFTSNNHHNMVDCPFMPAKNTVCAMTAFDHVNIWKNMFTAVIPVLIMAFVCWYVYVTIKLFVLELQQAYTSRGVPWGRAICLPLYQTLFSQGILHPKCP